MRADPHRCQMATRRKRSQRRRAASACPRKAGRSVQPGWVGPDRKEITEPSSPARSRPEGAAFVSATSARGRILFDDLVAELDAKIADVDARARDEPADLRLVLSAEGTTCVSAALLALVHIQSIWPSWRTSRWGALDARTFKSRCPIRHRPSPNWPSQTMRTLQAPP